MVPEIALSEKRITDLALANRLPSVASNPRSAEIGGLLRYGPNTPDLCRQEGRLVAKILKGAKSVDFPVAQPARFEPVVNVRTAEVLGLTLPQTILFRADRAIE